MFSRKRKTTKGGNQCNLIPYVFTFCNNNASNLKQKFGHVNKLQTDVAVASVFTGKTAPLLPNGVMHNIADYADKSEPLNKRLEKLYAAEIFSYLNNYCNDHTHEDIKSQNIKTEVALANYFEQQINRRFEVISGKAFIGNEWVNIYINYHYIIKSYRQHVERFYSDDEE